MAFLLDYGLYEYDYQPRLRRSDNDLVKVQ